MIQECLNMMFILTYYWEPCNSSICYLILGLYLWISCTYCAASSRLVYLISLILSTIILCLKSLLLLNMYLKDYFTIAALYPQVLSSLGIAVNGEFPLSLIHLIPEGVILVTSLVGYVLAVRGLISLASSSLNWYLGITAIWLCSCSMYSIPSVIYNFFTLYWVISEGILLTRARLDTISLLVSALTMFQVLSSLTAPLLTPYFLTDPLPPFLLTFTVKVTSYQLGILLFSTLTFSSIKREYSSSLPEALNQPLLEKDPTKLMQFLVLFMQFLIKVGLFLWVELNPGFTGLFILLWFGFALLETDVKANMKMIKHLLMPLIVFSYSFDYLSCFYLSQQNVNHFFMLMTVIIAAYLYKLSPIIKETNYSLPATWYGKIGSILISHTYMFSLIVLFTIGLSAINLLHTGLMILCLNYMSDVKHVRENWPMLVHYMIFQMFVREAWVNSKQLIPSEVKSHYLVDFIGLDSVTENGQFVTKDALNWVLLCCCSLQLYANRYCVGEKMDNYTNLVFRLISEAYGYFSNIEFWLIYIVLFVVAFFKEANLLNFVRCVLLIYIITKHLASPYTKINSNFARLNPDLRLLKVYCMLLLGVRYVYQFLQTYKGAPKNNKIGLEVYGKAQDLYYSMATDTILVVASVLAHRSNTYWKQSHDEFGTRKSEAYTVTGALKEKGKFKYSIFYNVFSRPFQYILLLTIGAMCVFWRLSLSMFIYMCIVCIYQLWISYRFYKGCASAKTALKQQKAIKDAFSTRNKFETLSISQKPEDLKNLRTTEWKIRAWVWRCLFIWTSTCLLMSYLRYFGTLEIVKLDEYLDTIYFLCGFSQNNEDIILLEAFGYFVVFALLVIERQCLQYNMPQELKTLDDGWVFDVTMPLLYKKTSVQIPGLNKDQSIDVLDHHHRRRSSSLFNTQKLHIKDAESYESIKKKINFISALNLIKVIAEVLIPMFLLILAFNKLTIISTVYVLSVFLILLLEKQKQTLVLNFIIVFCIIIQYGLMLLNFSRDVSPQMIPDAVVRMLASIGIPLTKSFKELYVAKYFNMGTSAMQLDYIIYDILIEIFVLIYWFYLSKREVQLTYLMQRLPQDKKVFKHEEEVFQTTFKAKVKNVLYDIKILFYKFSRFSIVIIVLLFTTQSQGVLTLFYTLFCLIFLYNENLLILKSFQKKTDEQRPLSPHKFSAYKSFEPLPTLRETLQAQGSHTIRLTQFSLNNENEPITKEDLSGIRSYLKLLKYFLMLIGFDLLFQSVIQIPFIGFDDIKDSEELKGWFLDFGASKLWDPNNNKANFKLAYNAIWFKILTFSILLVVEAMMKSKDFQTSHSKNCKVIQKESEEISLRMTYEFNRQRVQTNYKYEMRKQRFNKYVQELEKNIGFWNHSFKEPNKTEKEKVVKSENVNSEQEEKEKKDKGKLKKLQKSVSHVMSMIKLKNFSEGKSKNPMLGLKFHSKTEQKSSSKIITSLVKLVNPYLFNDFIKKVTVISTALPDRNSFIEKFNKKQMKKNKFFGIEEDLDESFDEQEAILEEALGEAGYVNEIQQENEYEVKLKDYPQLICYVLASNTQSLVYILFLVNHFQYASLESLVFPMTLFGYAMLEYPRPRIKYFRIMLVYTSFVLFVKFFLHLHILKRVDFISGYKDTFRTGFKPIIEDNVPQNPKGTNHIEKLEFYDYIFWDALLLFALLCREYYMIRIGMWKKIETDIESLEEAKIRLKIAKQGELASEDYPTVSETFKKPEVFEGSQESPDKPLRLSLPNKPKNLTFTERLIPKNPGEKPGRDFYLFTFMLQLIILVYLFFFFNKLDGMDEDISRSFLANQFQGRMIVAIIIVVVLIIFDRYVYIQHTTIALSDMNEEEKEFMKDYRKGKTFKKTVSLKKLKTGNVEESSKLDDEFQKMLVKFNEKDKKKAIHERAIKQLLIVKLVLHSVLLVFVHGMIFWYFSYGTEKDFNNNVYLKIFYVIYVVYLTIEAQQFRFGLPSFTEISFPLMRHISVFSSGAFKIYKGMPFLYELRTCVDWTFTNTALNIYQWLKLEEIQAQLFYNECTQNGLKYKKHGEKIQKFEKFQFGCLSLFIILLIILLPLFIFSTLNPILDPNKVLSAGMYLRLIVDDRVFRLYSMPTAENICSNETEFKNRGFNDSNEIQEKDFELMQRIDMPQSAEENWDITWPTKQVLKSKLESIIQGKQLKDNEFKMVLELTITRNYPMKLKTVSVINEHNLNKTHAQQLYDMMFLDKNVSFYFFKFTRKAYRLPSAGDAITPIMYTNESWIRDLKISLMANENGRFWNVSSHSYHDGDIGMRFYIVSDKYSSVTFNFSIITFYISIVFLAGKLIRMVTVGSGLNIVMTDMKNCEHLRTLCSAIFISRMTGKLLKEEELYYELIDILRSPEFTKVLTGSSSIKPKQD